MTPSKEQRDEWRRLVESGAETKRARTIILALLDYVEEVEAERDALREGREEYEFGLRAEFQDAYDDAQTALWGMTVRRDAERARCSQIAARLERSVRDRDEEIARLVKLVDAQGAELGALNRELERWRHGLTEAWVVDASGTDDDLRDDDGLRCDALVFANYESARSCAESGDVDRPITRLVRYGGATIEGDFVCPDSLALAEAQKENERLRGLLRKARWYVDDDSCAQYVPRTKLLADIDAALAGKGEEP